MAGTPIRELDIERNKFKNLKIRIPYQNENIVSKMFKT
jgi:hypothetical protein